MEIAELVVPNDGVLYTSNDVKLKIEENNISNGVLYITERSFSWKPDNRIEGISIPWPQISLHAIQSQPVPSIYIMVDTSIVWPGVYDAKNGHNNDIVNENNAEEDDEKDEGNESDEDEHPTTLMWLQPKDPNTLDIIFQAMQKAQSLNPDITSDRTSDEEDEFMEAENDDDEFEDVGQGDMRNLCIENEEKFADAEEE